MLKLGSALPVAAPGQAGPRKQRQQEAKDHCQQKGVLVCKGQGEAESYVGAPQGPSPLAPAPPCPPAHFPAAQGRCPGCHPPLACRRRVEPSRDHSGSYGCCCKPAEEEKRRVPWGQRPQGQSPPPPHTHTLKTTHPMAMAGDQTELQLLKGSVLAAPVLAHLWAVECNKHRGGVMLWPRDSSGREGSVGRAHHCRPTLGAWLHQAQVRQVQLGTWEQEGPPANHLPAVQAEGRVHRHRVWCQWALLPALALQLPALRIPGDQLECQAAWGGGVPLVSNPLPSFRSLCSSPHLCVQGT